MTPANSADLVFCVEVLQCPVCHRIVRDREQMIITLGPFAGAYCLYCYAAWVHEHLPMLQPAREKQR